MSILRKKRLEIATIVYWFLLVYIIAALVWWFIALQQQNHRMTVFELEQVNAADPSYLQKTRDLINEEHLKRAQYIGEGSTFLLLILIGAVFVYRAVRRQIKMSLQQQNFMMAVTHELKTPIAVAKLNLETLQKYKLDESKQQRLIAATLEETERLNILASNILISSQLDAGGYSLKKEKLDFSQLATNCAEAFRRRFPENKIETAIEPGIEITGDLLLLQILINNLLENAFKYSPKEGIIYIALQKKDNTCFISVKDEGTGIPDEEKKKIFDRFYRIGNEQVRKTKGTGLGLYLCKKIARDHGGNIRVCDNEPKGSIFNVHLPL